MSERFQLTELLVRECAHCTGAKLPAGLEPSTHTPPGRDLLDDFAEPFGEPRTALHNTACVRCPIRIQPGDLIIGSSQFGWFHAEHENDDGSYE